MQWHQTSLPVTYVVQVPRVARVLARLREPAAERRSRQVGRVQNLCLLAVILCLALLDVFPVALLEQGNLVRLRGRRLGAVLIAAVSQDFSACLLFVDSGEVLVAKLVAVLLVGLKRDAALAKYKRLRC